MPSPLLLDTDIGSDVDDELALALLWGSPEVELRGVCTTYGDTVLRARIVLRMAELAWRRVEVGAGSRVPRSGREVWWAGHEGDAYDALPPAPEADGVALLAERSAGARLLAIGPLTSVADALDAGAQPEELAVMGGEWADASVPEHNIASDSVAARRVLTSGVPTVVVGLETTRRVRFGEAEIARFAACGHLGAVLASEMRSWMRRWDEDFEVPHDPLTALALLEPGLFEFAEACEVEVSDGAGGSFGPEGAVRRLDRPGAVRVATGVDVDAARLAMAGRIARGLGER